jgi:hypothetical protein
MRSSSPTEYLNTTRSALLASGAPPSPFGTASGFSSSCRTREPRPARSSLGVRFLFRALSRRVRPSPLLRTGPLARTSSFQGIGSASPGVPAPTNTTTSGAPFTAAIVPDRLGGRGWLPPPRRCRPQGSCPSRRFQLRSRHCTDPLRDPPLRRGAPTLCGLIPCRSRPFGAALQSFPFPRSRTRSRGPDCFLAGSSPTAASAAMAGTFTIAFPVAPALSLTAHPRVNRDVGTVTTVSRGR